MKPVFAYAITSMMLILGGLNADAGAKAMGSFDRITYFGGSLIDEASGITEAPDGTLYIVGSTDSIDLPTLNAAQPTYGGGLSDIFVAHFSSDLSTLLSCTYLGGSGDDEGYAIAYDPLRQLVYVTGGTTSNDFPETAGGAQPGYAGMGDTVVAALTPDLSAIVRATYLGGSGDDTEFSIQQGAGRNVQLIVDDIHKKVYVTGDTASKDFPQTINGAQPSFSGGPRDVFVAAFSLDLTSLYQATYLGGSGDDQSFNMIVVPLKGVYVVGMTTSTNFPRTAGSFQQTLDGSSDCFVSLLTFGLNSQSSTYFGGSHADGCRGIAASPFTNTLYISGTTSSIDLPKTTYGAQPRKAGGTDGFISSMNLNLTEDYRTTYLGGDGNDTIRPGLYLNPSIGVIYVTGTTTSRDFPHTRGGAQPYWPGDSTYEGYISALTSDLSQLIQSTYYGGSTGHSGTHSILVDLDQSTGDVYYAAGTGASNLPYTEGAYQPTYAGGGHDAVVGMLQPFLTP